MDPGDYSKGKHVQCLRTVLEASDISERRTFTNPFSGIILAIPPRLLPPFLIPSPCLAEEHLPSKYTPQAIM